MGLESYSEPIENISEQASLEVLKDDILFILSNIDSNISEAFFDYFKDENIDLNKYSLSKAFIAIMKGEPLPEQPKEEPFDTDDKKIEGYIKMIAGNMKK